MTDVFISYSRKDKPFVERLHTSLTQVKRDIWVDWEDIPLTADWWKEVQNGIEAADTFVFIISPDSVRSEVCRNEIQHALDHNKRFIPILYREIVEEADKTQMHTAISSHNWVMFDNEGAFETSFQSLVEAMETDLSHVREHTRLLVRAREWDSGSRPKSGLLEGEALIKAEGWLAQAVYKKPAPTPLHQEYIFASRRNEINRQRTIVARVVTALVIAIAMAVLSFFLFLRARDAEQQARRSERKAADALVESEKNLRDAWNTQSRFLAAQSHRELESGSPQTALLLAVESLAHYPDGIYNPESYVALVNALRSPVREEAYMPGEGLVQSADWSTEGIFSYYSNALNSAYWIKLWETDGTLRQTIDNIQGSAGLSPNKTQFITWTQDNTLTLWNADGTEIQSLTLDSPIYSVWWNSDGSQPMIISEAAGLYLWSLADHTTQDFVFDFFWDTVELSPDESQFYLTSGNSVIIWDIKTNQQVSTYARLPDTAGGDMPEFPDPQQAIASSTVASTPLWNPDKTKIFFVQDTEVHLLALESGSWIELPHETFVNGAAWNGDGTQLVTWTAEQVQVWDAKTGDSISTLQLLPDQTAFSVQWFQTRDQILILTGAEVTLWTPEIDDILTLTHDEFIQGTTLSQDEDRLIVWAFESYGSPGTVYLWTTEGDLLYSLALKSTPLSAFWNKDETRLMTTTIDGVIQIWDLQPAAPLPTYLTESSFSGVVWNGDGTGVITWDVGGLVQVWDNAGNEISHFSVPEFIGPQAVNPDGTLLLSWNETSLNLWNIQTGQIQHTFPLETFIYGAQWEAGHYVVAITEGQILVWDVLTDSIVYTFPFDSATTTVGAWDVENKLILTWIDLTTVDLWNLETGEKIQSFVHDTAVNTAAFRYGRILTTDADGEVRLWEKESPSPVAAVQVGSSLYGADVNRDGTRLLTWTIDGKIDLWTPTGESVWSQQVRTFALGAVIWNRDETRLIATTFESGIFIWDTQEHLLYHMPYEGTVYVPVLSPDESRLLAWAYPRADLWPLNIEELLALADAQGGRELSREERGQFFLPPEATPEPEG